MFKKNAANMSRIFQTNNKTSYKNISVTSRDL